MHSGPARACLQQRLVGDRDVVRERLFSGKFRRRRRMGAYAARRAVSPSTPHTTTAIPLLSRFTLPHLVLDQPLHDLAWNPLRLPLHLSWTLLQLSPKHLSMIPCLRTTPAPLWLS